MRIDDDGNVAPTGPTGPARLHWTCLRPYGSDQYVASMFRTEGQDTLNFVKVGETPDRETEDGTLDLFFTKTGLDDMIAELTWLRDNWGKIGRDVG